MKPDPRAFSDDYYDDDEQMMLAMSMSIADHNEANELTKIVIPEGPSAANAISINPTSDVVSPATKSLPTLTAAITPPAIGTSEDLTKALSDQTLSSNQGVVRAGLGETTIDSIAHAHHSCAVQSQLHDVQPSVLPVADYGNYEAYFDEDDDAALAQAIQESLQQELV